jgi:hypothetical protein
MEQDAAASDFCRSKANLLCGERPLNRYHLLITQDLSLEFLMGRALDNAMLNVGLKDAAKGFVLYLNFLKFD